MAKIEFFQSGAKLNLSFPAPVRVETVLEQFWAKVGATKIKIEDPSKVVFQMAVDPDAENKVYNPITFNVFDAGSFRVRVGKEVEKAGPTVADEKYENKKGCLLYTSPSPRDS